MTYHTGHIEKLDPGVERLVDHRPGQPDGGQPADDPALSWPAHGGGDDAGERCQLGQGEGGGDPLDDRRESGRRQWW